MSELYAQGFTKLTRQAVAMASEEAVALGCDLLDSGHLLLGLLRQGVGPASGSLRRCGLDLAKARQISKTVSPPAPGPVEPLGLLPLAPSAEQALQLARDEARQQGRSYVEPQHLLMGLLATPEGPHEGVLHGCGADVSIVGMRLREALTPLVDESDELRDMPDDVPDRKR
jgi:ATP-dependent Clp protease ATP-binding subunit ClpC